MKYVKEQTAGLNPWETVGQKVHSGFSVTLYGKSQMNFLANIYHPHLKKYLFN